MNTDIDSFNEAIVSHIDNYEAQMYSALPATVVGYDATTQRVLCQPVMYEAYTSGESQEHSYIQCPLIQTGSGGGVLTFPVNVGDEVLLVMSSRNFDTWWSTSKAPSLSSTVRFNDYSDAIAILGLKSKNNSVNASTENVELQFRDADGNPLSSIVQRPDKSVDITSESGSSIKLLPDGNIEITTAATIKIQNSGEELVTLMSEFIEEVSKITTNTIYGSNTPVNNLPAFTELKSRLDTLKG